MILSFGCSHSCGPYDEKDFSLRRDAPRWDDKVVAPHENMYREMMNDWPSEVARNSNEKHYHIAISGHGILSYYEVLKAFEENGLLQTVDKLLIQHTHELRMVTGINPGDLQKHIHNRMIPDFKSATDDFIFRNIILGPVINATAPLSVIPQLKAINNKKPTVDQKLFLIDTLTNLVSLLSYTHTYKNIFDLTLAEIKRICERNNIKYYDFAWDTYSSYNLGSITQEFDKVQVISKDDFMVVKPAMGKEQYDTRATNNGGHLMKEGNDTANKIIIDYLHTTDIFT